MVFRNLLFLGISGRELGQPTVYIEPGQIECAGWPGSILVAKVNHSRFQQDKG